MAVNGRPVPPSQRVSSAMLVSTNMFINLLVKYYGLKILNVSVEQHVYLYWFKYL